MDRNRDSNDPKRRRRHGRPRQPRPDTSKTRDGLAEIGVSKIEHLMGQPVASDGAVPLTSELSATRTADDGLFFGRVRRQEHLDRIASWMQTAEPTHRLIFHTSPDEPLDFAAVFKVMRDRRLVTGWSYVSLVPDYKYGDEADDWDEILRPIFELCRNTGVVCDLADEHDPDDPEAAAQSRLEFLFAVLCTAVEGFCELTWTGNWPEDEDGDGIEIHIFEKTTPERDEKTGEVHHLYRGYGVDVEHVLRILKFDKARDVTRYLWAHNEVMPRAGLHGGPHLTVGSDWFGRSVTVYFYTEPQENSDDPPPEDA